MLRLFTERAKVGAETVKGTVVVAVWLPYVPVMVTLYWPTMAELLAASVSVLVPVVGFGEKDAVTPLGRPEAERVTLPVNPFSGVTLMLLVPEAPWPRLRLLAERVNVGAAMVRAKVAVSVSAPDFPVMVTVYCPTAVELLAVNVNVLFWYPVTWFGEKEAVTPLGRPEAERAMLPVNPFWGDTLM